MARIPVIDLFAGPGGLGEGFSAVSDDFGNRAFDLRLSVEKDQYAHETLKLRSFFRQFPSGGAPQEYYDLIRSGNMETFIKKRELLFRQFPEESARAAKEAWNATLGEVPVAILDKRIRAEIGNNRTWVLIGGPPCQAYSVVGRVRNGGVDENDHRVYLYKEYLRIIAKHKPAIFVMENVKGLLSAKLNDQSIFDMILRDLRKPSDVFPETDCPQYRIFSLSSKPVEYDPPSENPVYKKDTDYLIESEKYGIPQKRHRIILIGIREDLKVQDVPILKESDSVSLREVIGDLPRIRSGLFRRITSQTEDADGRVRFEYEMLEDNFQNWRRVYSELRKEIFSVNGFSRAFGGIRQAPPYSRGGEFIEAVESSRKPEKLSHWYFDERLRGFCNHASRAHLDEDLKRYFFASSFQEVHGRSPLLHDYPPSLLPRHKNAKSGKFADRFRAQAPDQPATTITSHISKDGHYFIHYDPVQCRSLTVREAARVQTFPDNYFFCGSRTAQYTQVGNAVPPYLAYQIAGIVKGILE
ncbi:MAG: DNA cytosine methyltransferase [Phaeodactylibacter sp.]|nr:DNA cytosine methyltransferase [Phaeodactylibacter sp.]MCB9302641.1 DNA cytosine methyltransferase [Lewinellaceae bacterium]